MYHQYTRRIDKLRSTFHLRNPHTHPSFFLSNCLDIIIRTPLFYSGKAHNLSEGRRWISGGETVYHRLVGFDTRRSFEVVVKQPKFVCLLPGLPAPFSVLYPSSSFWRNSLVYAVLFRISLVTYNSSDYYTHSHIRHYASHFSSNSFCNSFIIPIQSFSLQDGSVFLFVHCSIPAPFVIRSILFFTLQIVVSNLGSSPCLAVGATVT
jgi:hypothetical protein